VAPSGLALTILGSDGSYPGPGGACSGYLLTGGDGFRLWMDAGAGTLANLQRHLPVTDIDAVVLSHAHPDHWTDIEGFYVACRYAFGRAGVPIYAPAELHPLARVEDDGTLLWHDIADGSRVTIGGIRLGFHRTDHPVETLAVRVDAGGRSIGYSADTGPGWSFADLGPVDLALVEASFLSDKEGTVQHLSGRQAGLAAREAGAGRLVVTHVSPTVDRVAVQAEAAASFGRPVDVAVPGVRFLT
jgi:ribonuclease BN (tRNA processing enzyme)